MKIEADGQIAAVSRSVRDRIVDGKPARAVVLAQTYPTTIEDLWDAVTGGDRIPRWLAPVHGELRLGGHYQLEGNAGGTVTACEPPHSFDATWEFGGDVSWIEVRLAPVDAGRTRIELTHIAYPSEHWANFGPGAVGIGWDLSFLGLRLHVVSGESKEPGDDAWIATPAGVQFMTESGEAWCAADIANGEDPGTARGAAARTLAAYTGTPPAE